jgi:hypothetical protein
MGDLLAEDLARARAQQGQVPPRLREVERRLDTLFSPPFEHVDRSDRRELFRKQFIGRMKTPLATRALSRGEDPTRETSSDKLRRVAAQPYFLGRRTLVFARQRRDGELVELVVRESSGFRPFDEDALGAVARALEGRPPRLDEGQREAEEVRMLWQLDATGYVVYAPTPTLVFDEATGKSEWTYPLQKRIDRAVRLVAVY